MVEVQDEGSSEVMVSNLKRRIIVYKSTDELNKRSRE